MWCGLIGGKLLGTYFYDETLTGRRCLHFLVNQLSLLLNDFVLAGKYGFSI